LCWLGIHDYHYVVKEFISDVRKGMGLDPDIHFSGKGYCGVKICLKCGKVADNSSSIMLKLEEEIRLLEEDRKKEENRNATAKELYKIYKDKETVQK
jgi:hypothetical protein